MRSFSCVPLLFLVLGCGSTVQDKSVLALPKYDSAEFFVNYYTYGKGDGCSMIRYNYSPPETFRIDPVVECRNSRGSTEYRWRFLKTDDNGDHYSYQVAITYDDGEGVILEPKEFVYNGSEQVLFKDHFQRIGIRPVSPEDLEYNRKEVERLRRQVNATG